MLSSRVPEDVIFYIGKYFTLWERKGLPSSFASSLSSLLWEPRSENGQAYKKINYYRRIHNTSQGFFKRMGFSKDTFYHRRSHLDFEFFLILDSTNEVTFARLIMFSQWNMDEKIKTILKHQLLTIPFYSLPIFPIPILYQNENEITIHWQYSNENGYLMPDKCVNSSHKIFKDAMLMTQQLLHRVQKIKKKKFL